MSFVEFSKKYKQVHGVSQGSLRGSVLYGFHRCLEFSSPWIWRAAEWISKPLLSPRHQG